jgi:hypothetical protein
MMCEEGSDFFLNRMSYIDSGESGTLSHCLIGLYDHIIALLQLN